MTNLFAEEKTTWKKTRASLLNTLTAKSVRFIYRNKTLGVGLVLKPGQTVSSWYLMRWLSVICSSFPVFTAATQIYLIYMIVSSTGKYNSKCLYVDWWIQVFYYYGTGWPNVALFKYVLITTYFKFDQAFFSFYGILWPVLNHDTIKSSHKSAPQKAVGPEF